MPRNYSARILKILFARSGNVCAKPGCGNLLIADATEHDRAAVIGEIAHMIGSSDAGPRANPSVDTTARDEEENLVLLCPTHHAEVDGQPGTYSVEELRGWKAEHEAWVRDQLASAVTEVTFAELEVVAKAVAGAEAVPDPDLTLLTVQEKMDLNGLSSRVAHDVQIGLLGAAVVQDFIEQYESIDAQFGERLSAGFVAEYDRLRAEGLAGDELYGALTQFAGGNSPDFRRQAAGRAILAHLFQVCEVFEK